MTGFLIPMFEMMDALRRAQGQGLRALGFGPEECRYEIVASTPLWRLRRYATDGTGPSVLIVAAPIKRPYIWDLAPSASVVRYCLREGMRLHLLEWVPPSHGRAAGGLADYAADAISAAVAVIAKGSIEKPVVMGHSLGGTLAAIFAGLHSDRVAALVVVSAPLCLSDGVSRYRDALAANLPRQLPAVDTIPGSLLSQLSTAAAPATFVWSRMLDAMTSVGDRRASEMRSRVEQWALDEVPISGRLAQAILRRIYCENRLCAGTLDVAGRLVDPRRIDVPILAVANAQDDVTPPATMRPFLEMAGTAENRMIEYPGETGVVLQHLGILVGKIALDRYWPEIVAWIKARG